MYLTPRNFRAVYLTNSLEEMARFGQTMGAQTDTFLYLSGLGDLLATSLSEHSHNRRFGERLAQGQSLEQIEADMGVLPEGYRTVSAVLYLAEKHGLRLPMRAILTVGQFSFWGNYLPRVYPLHLRGTGESFAANIGGRMVGTSFAWITSTLAVQSWVPGASPSTKLAYTAAGVAFLVYAVGTITCFWLPEPTDVDLPE